MHIYIYIYSPWEVSVVAATGQEATASLMSNTSDFVSAAPDSTNVIQRMDSR